MKQFTDLFGTRHGLIDRHSSPLLNEARDEAFRTFKGTGFPVYGTEEYQHTDIGNLLESVNDIEERTAEGEMLLNRISGYETAADTAHHYFTINGYFYKENPSSEGTGGVFCGSVNEFAGKYPGLFARYYNWLAKGKGDGISAFNTMFATDGCVLYVPEDKKTDYPVRLTNLIDGKAGTMANLRILIILEKGAEAKIEVCDRCLSEKHHSVAVEVVEIYAGENASLELYRLEDSTDQSIRLSVNYVKQERYSNVAVQSVTLRNGITRNNYQIDLDGEYAEHYIRGLVIADKEQRVDNHTVINHNVPRCHSDELFKYLLSDKSVAAFSGKINVAKDAQKTMAYQNHRNLLNGMDCRVFSKPQLEIYADDVKCSHGMTTGQMDETVLMYMRSRGIPEEEARMMLRFAFAGEIIDGIRDEELRKRLSLSVEQRIRGEKH